MATNKTTGIVRAIKIINKDRQQPNQYTRMLDEIKILKTLVLHKTSLSILMFLGSSTYHEHHRILSR